MDKFHEVLQYLPPGVAVRLSALPQNRQGRTEEIRLRVGRPITLSLPDGPQCLPGTELTAEELEACFVELCEHSVHSHDAELADGYLTMPGGCRVGVAGVSVLRQGLHIGFNRVTSLNIRIAQKVRTVIPPDVTDFLRRSAGSLLVAGPPGSGKTTFLRALIYEVSRLECTVTVVDERNEILPCGNDIQLADMPLLCDVLTGCPKAQGVLMALRTQKPDYIALDELGGMEDVKALENGLYSGVHFLFTLHAGSLQELSDRPQFKALEQLRAVKAILLLGPKAGQISTFWER